MKPSLQKSASVRLAITAVLLSTVLLSASGASAHLRESWNRWYFGGSTHVIKDGQFKPFNPVTVIFFRGGTASLATVTQHLDDDWRNYYWQTDMDDHDCAMSGTQHYIPFRALNDLIPGNPAPWWDAQDEAWSTDYFCDTQYHMRGWDDYEHWAQTYGHTSRDQWVIANIHHEYRRWIVGGRHIVDESWDASAKRLRDRMEEHCSYLNWRWLPGSWRPKDGLASNGYITLIMMRHVSAPGPCPKP
jgi:hypothetical protein